MAKCCCTGGPAISTIPAGSGPIQACSHPVPEREVQDAAHRRLQEEWGFDCQLQKIFTFTYHATFDNGLIEHEYDHVFLGTFDGDIVPDTEEVAEYGFFSLQEIGFGRYVKPPNGLPTGSKWLTQRYWNIYEKTGSHSIHTTG